MNWVKGHLQLIALTLIVAFLWSWPVMVPLKILVVFFHEISHGIAAVVTGGEIVSISISADQGGEAWTRGGSRFVTLSAGYLGSLLIGIVLLLCGDQIGKAETGRDNADGANDRMPVHVDLIGSTGNVVAARGRDVFYECVDLNFLFIRKTANTRCNERGLRGAATGGIDR